MDGAVLQPVFVDLSGRRAFHITRAARVVVGLVTLYLLLLGAAVAWGPSVGRVSLPDVDGIPGSGSGHAPAVTPNDRVVLDTVGTDRPTATAATAVPTVTPAAADTAPSRKSGLGHSPATTAPAAPVPASAPGNSASAPGHLGTTNSSSHGQGARLQRGARQAASDQRGQGRGGGATAGNGHGRAVGNPH